MIKKICLILVLFFICSHNLYASESVWSKIDENSFVNYETITGTPDFYGYSFLLKSYNKGQYEPINGRKIKYTLVQHEINCAKHTYRLGTIDSYDSSDMFVNGDYNKYAQFQPIVQGSAVNEVEKKVCRLYID